MALNATLTYKASDDFRAQNHPVQTFQSLKAHRHNYPAIMRVSIWCHLSRFQFAGENNFKQPHFQNGF